MDARDSSQQMVKKMVKMKFLPLQILYKIKQGKLNLDIQQEIGFSKQRLNYYIKRLKSANLIFKVGSVYPAKYELTQNGKNLMIQHHSFAQHHINLHNIAWDFPILKEGTTKPDKTWQAKGTTFKDLTLLFDNSICYLRWAGSTLTMGLSNVIAKTGHEAQDKARSISNIVIEMLKKDGFILGQPFISRKPQFAFVSGITKRIAKDIQLVTDRYEVNSSQSQENGEIELFTAEDADNFIDNILKTGKQLEMLNTNFMKLFYIVDSQAGLMTKFTEQIALHLEVMTDMKETMRGIRDGINEMTRELKK